RKRARAKATAGCSTATRIEAAIMNAKGTNASASCWRVGLRASSIMSRSFLQALQVLKQISKLLPLRPRGMGPGIKVARIGVARQPGVVSEAQAGRTGAVHRSWSCDAQRGRVISVIAAAENFRPGIESDELAQRRHAGVVKIGRAQPHPRQRTVQVAGRFAVV